VLVLGSYVVACRKGVSTQLEAPSRNCTRLSGLKVLVRRFVVVLVLESGHAE